MLDPACEQRNIIGAVHRRAARQEIRRAIVVPGPDDDGRSRIGDQLVEFADPERGRFGHGLLLKRSEEHTSELQSLMRISYAVFCLKKKKKIIDNNTIETQR